MTEAFGDGLAALAALLASRRSLLCSHPALLGHTKQEEGRRLDIGFETKEGKRRGGMVPNINPVCICRTASRERLFLLFSSVDLCSHPWPPRQFDIQNVFGAVFYDLPLLVSVEDMYQVLAESSKKKHTIGFLKFV